MSPDQAGRFVGPDLGPNCSQRLSADNTCIGKEFNRDRGIAVPRSAVGNVSGYRCVSDCISGGREFDPGPVPYFRGD